MAWLQLDFQSGTLKRKVTVNVIIPAEAPFPGMPDRRPYRSFYLLHGYMGNNADWMLNAQIEELAMRYNMAFIMPSGENSFYTDWEASNSKFSEFIGNELVDFTRKLLPLSDKREDTFIGGLSMGGYGALYNGLRHYNTFGHIIALSSALIYGTAKDSTDEPNMLGINRAYFEMVFGDIDNIENSEVNLSVLAKRIKTESDAKNIPLDIYFACGWNDHLVLPNRELARDLKKLGIEHVYEEGAGTHEWRFWHDFLRKGLEHVYPPDTSAAPPIMPFWIDKPGEFSYEN